MQVDIVFKTSSTPKVVDGDAVYTKGALLCVETRDGLILKYPLCNVFSVTHDHQPHRGSSKTEIK